MIFFRQTTKTWRFFIGLLLLLVFGAVFSQRTNEAGGPQPVDPIAAEALAAPKYVKAVTIEDGATFQTLLEGAGIGARSANDIYVASLDIYDLALVRVGKTLELVFGESESLEELRYDIDTEEQLLVTRVDGGWRAERKVITYAVTEKVVRGAIASSLYESAIEAGMDERAVITFADAFQWTIDFAMDVRQGDTYTVVYEERFRDGVYAGPGRVIAGKFVNQGSPAYLFSFQPSDGDDGHYDIDGNAAKRAFLKAPVAYKYISSGFTTGRRYVQAFNVSTGHRAIDYAASYGTPIRAVGDGTVVRAGWNGPYGNEVSIRHNGTFSTNYAHMSKIAVRSGQGVSQGELIGYVGSTGFSTGPHVHYELVKNGVKVNPMEESLPPGEPIQESDRAAFEAVVAQYRPLLDQ